MRKRQNEGRSVRQKLGGYSYKRALLAVTVLLISVSWLFWGYYKRFDFARDYTQKYLHVGGGPAFTFPLQCLARDFAGAIRTSKQRRCLPVWKHYFQYSARMVHPGAYLLALLGAILSFLIFRSGAPPEEPAEGRLAEEADLEANGYLAKRRDGKPDPGSIFIGLFPADAVAEGRRRRTLQLPEEELERHTLVEAGTREGKTSTYVKNVVMSAAYQGHTVILWDQKFRDVSGLIETVAFYRYYNRAVFIFAPFEPEGARIPILDAVTDFNSGKRLGEAMIAPAGDESVEYYRRLERELFAVLALAVTRLARAQRRTPRISEIVDLISKNSPEEILAVLEEAAQGATHDNENPYYWGKIVFEENKNKGKLVDNLISLREKLSLFKMNPNVDRATSRGHAKENLDLEAIFRGDYGPALFYIGIPKSEVGSPSSEALLRLIKLTLDGVLDKVAEESGRLPYQTHYLLDEFQNFGEIPRITESLAVDGSKRLSYTILIQDRSKLIDTYGKDRAMSIWSNNTGNKFYYLGGLDPAVMLELEELIGERSYVEEARRRPSLLLERMDQQEQRALRTKPVLSRSEMKRMPQGTVLANLHRAPWTLMQAVILEDPRNPFHREYQEIRKNMARYAEEWEILAEDIDAGVESEGQEPSKLEAWLLELLEANAPVHHVRGLFDTYLIIEGLDLQNVPDELKKSGCLETTRHGVRLTKVCEEQLPEDLRQRLREHSQKVDALQQLSQTGHAYALTGRGLVPLADDGKGQTLSLQEGAKYATLIVDTPSGDVFLRGKAQIPAVLSPMPAVERSQALGLPNPETWYTISGGRLAFGLLPRQDLTKRYLEIGGVR